MLSEEQIAAQRSCFVGLLESTERKGISTLIGYLDIDGFFEAPASSRFHGSYYGGLCKHSLEVYELLAWHADQYKPKILGGRYGVIQYNYTSDNLIIAGLLHDLCKINAYQRTKADDGFTNNRSKEKGHARLSLDRIRKYIELEKIEVLMIKFHMGIYGTVEFQDLDKKDTGEYHLRGDHLACEGMSKEDSKKFRYGKSLVNAYYHNPICKVMSICDELATMKEKADGN